MRVRLANLLKDETLEQTMIAFHDALLRVDIKKCVTDSFRDEFVSGIETLKRDSEFHRVAVKKWQRSIKWMERMNNELRNKNNKQ